MKYVMTASIAFIYPNHHWGKPLNPILGETYQATLPDGSEICMEQVCHHPPVSYINVEGANGIFRFSGYSVFSIKAYLNSISLEVKGHKKISFPDGTEITYNNQ